MEMTPSHAVTLLIRRVVFIGNNSDTTHQRDRVLKLAKYMVDGLESVPNGEISFLPAESLGEMLKLLKGEDMLLMVPEGLWRGIPEDYDKYLRYMLRYRTETSKGKIHLMWSPEDGGSFSQIFGNEEVDGKVVPEKDAAEDFGFTTSGRVRPHAIKDKGRMLPLRVEYEPAGHKRAVRDD